MEAEKVLQEKVIQDMAKSKGKYTYKLARKIKIADKEYSELTLDFEKLTGADMEAVAALSNEGSANFSEFSKTYLMNIVARAANITINELRHFPIADCTVLTLRAQAFLLGAASEAI